MWLSDYAATLHTPNLMVITISFIIPPSVLQKPEWQVPGKVWEIVEIHNAFCKAYMYNIF